MYSHGPHVDVTDLELSPIVEMWSDILRFRIDFADKPNIWLPSPRVFRLLNYT